MVPSSAVWRRFSKEKLRFTHDLSTRVTYQLVSYRLYVGSNLLITDINKEVIFHKMVFESLNLGRTQRFKFGVRVHQRSATVSRLRFAIALPSREYDPENMLLRAFAHEAVY